MSTKIFKSTAPGSNATIEFAATDGNMTLYVRQNIGAIDLSASDAPTLALAILEAAGVKACAKEFGATAGTMAQLEDIAWALADYSNAKALEAEQAADREAFEHARRVMDCRRNNLAIDLTKNRHASYEVCSPSLKSAIDRVIELEDQATK